MKDEHNNWLKEEGFTPEGDEWHKELDPNMKLIFFENAQSAWEGTLQASYGLRVSPIYTETGPHPWTVARQIFRKFSLVEDELYCMAFRSPEE